MSEGTDFLSIDMSAQEQRLETVKTAQRNGVSQWLSRMQSGNQVPPPDDNVGAHQRLQFRVPTAGKPDGTLISAGRRTETASFDGYAVKTNAHVAVSAEGGVAVSTMTLQSNGQLMVQSDQASLFLLSTAPATLASTSVTNVAGAGVVIAAGGGAPVAMVPLGGEGPPTPTSVSGAASAAQAAADAWSSWDDAVASSTSARDDLRAAITPGAASYTAPAGGATAKAVLVDANKAGEQAAGGAGGLVLHGEESVLIGTPKAGAFRAAETLTLSSKSVTMISHDATEVAAGKGLTATIGDDASLYAGKKMELVAHEGVLELATRTGAKVRVQAKEIVVGETAPSDPQLPTETIKVASTTNVSVTTDRDAVASAGIHLDSHDRIVARSAKTVTIEAPESITLKIGDQQIDLVVDSEGKIELRAKGAKVSLSDREGVGLTHRSEIFRGKSDKVTMGTGPSDKIEIASGSVALKGGSIKIG
ncbi:MAG: hypothetical protein IT378_23765 [Sandaracinaceae bacterium]|nr:hypothetical protein [Sandaracinaceae bacterium]